MEGIQNQGEPEELWGNIGASITLPRIVFRNSCTLSLFVIAKYTEFLSSFNSVLFFLVNTEIILPLEKYNVISVAINVFSEVIFLNLMDLHFN